MRTKMYCYQLYGLTVGSELSFPEFNKLSEQTNQNIDSYDLIIRFGKVAKEGLPHAEVKEFCYQLNELSCWLNINTIGRYLIDSGKSITIEPHEHIDEDSLKAFILEPCIGIALAQRELFVFKGNTLKVNGHNIALLGDYGCGKSSVSAAFLQNGHKLSSDGLCVINKEYEQLPGYPSIQLWFDSAVYFNKDFNRSLKIRPQINKFSFAINNNFAHQKQVIDSIFILNMYKEDNFSAQTLLGSEKIMHLQKHIYHKKQVFTHKKSHTYFNFLIQLASKVPITLINRPIKHFRINELAKFIQETGNLV